jgi:hypothetical protein
MTATELLRFAGLLLVLPCVLTPGACAPASADEDEVAPEAAVAHPSAQCVTRTCDPLCVDGGRYRVTPDVVDDTKSDGRLWQRRVAVRLTQPEAMRYCADLTLDDLRGWRLPSPVELNSIRYQPGGLFGGGSLRHYCIPCVDQVAFPETPADPFWTSRSGPDETAWYVGFDDGRMHRDVRTDELWVRCMHDPPAAAP